ncbi:ankyrin repeat domain-containing protein 49 isoform X1 [Folsomia candida]|uniref:ankyrin repeat domain-containing protein 49 isoform X1 n=1 Tax=Folsomia candida TaxID=158441 RepID=UPI001604EC59|nr:ankyrin repeat domain-containing protein 49 isoform X1 [Folsomia candida]
MSWQICLTFVFARTRIYLAKHPYCRSKKYFSITDIMEEEDDENCADLKKLDMSKNDDDDDDEINDALGPLREYDDLEAQMECLKAKSTHPEMFVSGFDVDDQGIEDAEDPNSPGELLLKSAEDGDLNLIAKLMAENPTLVSYQDQDGYTALHRASYSDHSEVIKYLIAHGAQVEKGTEDGWTPLHCATHWNSYKAARQLVNSNANVNAQTNGGQTPLHIASNQQSRECMIILLSHPGIDITLKNSLGETPLDLALRAGRYAYLFEMCDESINKLD